jgi:pimeloyl-ACP methyl ester carboxylesterase
LKGGKRRSEKHALTVIESGSDWGNRHLQTQANDSYLAVGDMQLECRLIGEAPAHSPTIVMLHEGLGSIRTWGEFPQLLSEATGASVFVYSRDGYGSSPVTQKQLPLDYIRRHAASVLPRILDQIGFSRGILLGHSDGGSMAAAYGGTANDPRLRGLVLMAPHFHVEDATLAEIRNARTAYENRDLRQRLSRYHADVDAAFLRWSDVWLDPQFLSFDLSPELSRIDVPTLVIRGDDDRYGTHGQVRKAEAFHRGPLRTMLMPGCGHVPHREKPAQTVDAIAAFCKPLLGMGGAA